ncbi:MAG TPA: 50S ribosomal protein L29 [Candidatus Paceibacterota bacterium]
MAKKETYKLHSAQELDTVVSGKREELRVLRFGAAGSKNKNVKLGATLRKQIARALTAKTALGK